jgi:uncharacterized membrane protein YkvA (DUF1232 family)
MLKHFRQRAHRLKAEVMALYFAYRDPRVSWVVKALVVCVVAYALSPIDLIPDFIPLLGLLDDLILLPLGIALVIRLLPPAVMDDARRQAALVQDKPIIRGAAWVIIGIWIGLLVLLLVWLDRITIQ